MKNTNKDSTVFKDNVCISIDNSELSKYLSDGWEQGNLFLRGIKKGNKNGTKISNTSL